MADEELQKFLEKSVNVYNISDYFKNEQNHFWASFWDYFPEPATELVFFEGTDGQGCCVDYEAFGFKMNFDQPLKFRINDKGNEITVRDILKEAPYKNCKLKEFFDERILTKMRLQNNLLDLENYLKEINYTDIKEDLNEETEALKISDIIVTPKWICDANQDSIIIAAKINNVDMCFLFRPFFEYLVKGVDCNDAYLTALERNRWGEYNIPRDAKKVTISDGGGYRMYALKIPESVLKSQPRKNQKDFRFTGQYYSTNPIKDYFKKAMQELYAKGELTDAFLKSANLSNTPLEEGKKTKWSEVVKKEVDRVFNSLKEDFDASDGHHFKSTRDACDSEFEIENDIKEDDYFWDDLKDKLYNEGIELHIGEIEQSDDGSYWYYYVYLTRAAYYDGGWVDEKNESLNETKKDEWEVKLIFRDGRTKIGIITNNEEEAAEYAKDQYNNNDEVKDFNIYRNHQKTPFDGAYYDCGGYYQDHVGGYGILGEDWYKDTPTSFYEKCESISDLEDSLYKDYIALFWEGKSGGREYDSGASGVPVFIDGDIITLAVDSGWGEHLKTFKNVPTPGPGYKSSFEILRYPKQQMYIEDANRLSAWAKTFNNSKINSAKYNKTLKGKLYLIQFDIEEFGDYYCHIIFKVYDKDKNCEYTLDKTNDDAHESSFFYKSCVSRILSNYPDCPLFDSYGTFKRFQANLGWKNIKEDIEFNDDITEAVEIHDQLNPKIWTEDKELRPEVRAKVLQIVDKFKSQLLVDNVDLKVEDIYILGSNANYNYTEESDLDVHIIADESFDCSAEHLPLLYNCYKALFNSKYDIRIKGINVELYVENKDKLSNVSAGIYSLKEGWIRNPSEYEIPEFDQLAVDRGVQEWEDRYYAITENPSLKKIDDYINELYELRKSTIQNGEFAEGNLIFKEIRRLGYLDDLKELKVDLTSQELSLEGLQEDQQKLRYHYRGPVYHFQNLLSDDWEAYTEAVSDAQALNNLTAKAKNHFGYILQTRITLNPDYLELVTGEEDIPDEKFKPVAKCEKCGHQLNDAGECPVCDLGDESINEALNKLTEEQKTKLQELLKDLD